MHHRCILSIRLSDPGSRVLYRLMYVTYPIPDKLSASYHMVTRFPKLTYIVHLYMHKHRNLATFPPCAAARLGS